MWVPVYNVSKLHRPRISDAFLADTVDATRVYSRFVHLRFCGVLCIARSVSQPRHAQLTRCFSAVAELLMHSFRVNFQFFGVTSRHYERENNRLQV